MNLNNNRLITTDDGTCSIYSNTFGEAMHSSSGAYEESLLKHVLPSRVLERTGASLNVLDVGFGIGYNILALLVEFIKARHSSSLHILSFESDFSHIPLMTSIAFSDGRDAVFSSILEAARNGEFISPRYCIKIHRGDARTGIQKLHDNIFDAVFHDPFSPAKNPELWSVDFFNQERRVMKDHGVLTTYSSALHARSAMAEAGLKIGRGPSVGKKREGTLAAVQGDIPIIDSVELAVLLGSNKATPFRDPLLSDSREEIIRRRQNEIQLKRDHPARR